MHMYISMSRLTLHALTSVLASTQSPTGKVSLVHHLISMAKEKDWSVCVCSAFVPAQWLMPMAPPVPLPPAP